MTGPVDDAALAELVAVAAVRTPGVARLHPYVTQAARQAVNSAARRVTARLGSAGVTGAPVDGADPGAVDVERDPGTAAVTVTVRIVATTRPPVVEVVRELQQRIGAEVADRTGATPLVVVNVLDVDVPEAVAGQTGRAATD